MLSKSSTEQNMPQKELQKLLTSIGFSQKEALVYLTALALGPCTVLAISRKSGLKRTTIYTVIDSLKRNGSMSIKIIGFKRLFVAHDPHTIQQMLDEHTAKLSQHMPNLLELQRVTQNDDGIGHYEGRQAIKTVYEDVLADLPGSNTYFVIGNQEFWYTRDSDYHQRFIEKRAKIAKENDLTIKLLLQDSALTRQHMKKEQEYAEIIRVLPKSFGLQTNLIITDSRVVVHDLSNPETALVIRNPSIITLHKELFKSLWEKNK